MKSFLYMKPSLPDKRKTWPPSEFHVGVLFLALPSWVWLEQALWDQGLSLLVHSYILMPGMGSSTFVVNA